MMSSDVYGVATSPDTNSFTGHKLRHSRKYHVRLINNQRQRKQHVPTGSIEMSVILPSPPPPSLLPPQPLTRIISNNNTKQRYRNNDQQQTRPQRSPNNNKQLDQQQQQQQQRQQRKRYCQEKDVARNAYYSNTVVLARAESMSSNRVSNYSVTFRILKKFKSKYRLDDTLRITFLNDNNNNNNKQRVQCEQHPYGIGVIVGDNKTPRGGLVKARIQQSKEYYLFLNSDGMHRYTVQGMPVLRKKKLKGRKDIVEVTIRRITDNKFGKSRSVFFFLL